MGVRLIDDDESLHSVGPESNWNESRYVDFFDPAQGIGGWLRIGVRPNEGHAEVSTCVYLPDGSVAFGFSRTAIDTNAMSVGGQAWLVVEPYRLGRVSYSGDALLITDPWTLAEPRVAYQSSPSVRVDLDLDVRTGGLDLVMGADQADIDRIFLPGQADFHYQHLAWTTGTVKVDGRSWLVGGRGAKDYSWGPRNWHAKTYLRWLTGVVDDATGFMLVRAVGPTKQTRSGHVCEDGRLHLIDDFQMRNEYDDGPAHRLKSVTVTMRAGERTWTATGTPTSWLPLRHRQRAADGEEKLSRIVKSPCEWVWGDGRLAAGSCEYHDLMIHGSPVGLHD